MRSRSISELEKSDWPKPGPKTPSVFVRCYELRQKPLSQLTVRDMRVLIGQDIGLVYLLPMALCEIEKDPLQEAEHFKGDLLAVVLRASSDFYGRHPDLRVRVENALRNLPLAMESLDFVDFDTASEALEEAALEFHAGVAHK
jgi:CDI immunity proteins